MSRQAVFGVSLISSFIVISYLCCGFSTCFMFNMAFLAIFSLAWYYRISVVNIVIKIRRWSVGVPESSIITTDASTKNGVILICYKFEGVIQKVYLPFKQVRFAMKRYYGVKTINGIEERLDITQHKGLNYYITAKDIGYEKIISVSIGGDTEIIDQIKDPDSADL